MTSVFNKTYYFDEHLAMQNCDINVNSILGKGMISNLKIVTAVMLHMTVA